MISRALKIALLATAAVLPSTLVFGRGAGELELKGLRIGDSLLAVRQKASLSCTQPEQEGNGSSPRSAEVQAAMEETARVSNTDYQSCYLPKVSTLGGLKVSRFDLAFYSGTLQQIIVNMQWTPPRGVRAGRETDDLYRADIAAWVQAIREQYGSVGLTERQFRHRASFDVLHWAFIPGTVDLTVTTYYRSSDNIVLVLESAAFSNQEKAREAAVNVTRGKLQSARATDAQRKQTERAEVIKKDLQ